MRRSPGSGRWDWRCGGGAAIAHGATRLNPRSAFERTTEHSHFLQFRSFYSPKNLMITYRLPVLLLALNLIAVSSIQAGTIHTGSMTVTWTQSGAMTLTSFGDLLRFSHETVSGVRTPNTHTSFNGSLVADFQADAGLIFDKMYFGGLSGGATYLDAGGAHSYLNWDVHGGSFTGPATYGGANSPNEGRYREWAITGPTTGTSLFGDGYWFRTSIYDFNDPVYGGGFYDIGASNFSMDITSFIQIYHVGGQWANAINPQSLNFSFTYLEAPAAVPESSATLGLFALALAGVIGTRRFFGRTPAVG
jgi:hypothetical protein